MRLNLINHFVQLSWKRTRLSHCSICVSVFGPLHQQNQIMNRERCQTKNNSAQNVLNSSSARKVNSCPWNPSGLINCAPISQINNLLSPSMQLLHRNNLNHKYVIENYCIYRSSSASKNVDPASESYEISNLLRENADARWTQNIEQIKSDDTQNTNCLATFQTGVECSKINA